MPKRRLAPQIAEISPAEHKSRKRRIKRLVHLRLAYGKGTFFETHTHQPRYPIDEISIALYKVLCKANKINKHLDLSTEEKDLWKQIFTAIAIAFAACFLGFLTDLSGDGMPDMIEFLYHLVDPDPSRVTHNDKPLKPDFIEKALGLEDDAIEKSLGLPDHSLEQFLKADSEAYSEKPAHSEKPS